MPDGPCTSVVMRACSNRSLVSRLGFAGAIDLRRLGRRAVSIPIHPSVLDTYSRRAKMQAALNPEAKETAVECALAS